MAGSITLNYFYLFHLVDIGEWKITMSAGKGADRKNLSSSFMFDRINSKPKPSKSPGEAISILIRRKHIGTAKVKSHCRNRNL